MCLLQNRIGESSQYEDIHADLDQYGYNLKLKKPSPYQTKEETCSHCNKLIAPQKQRHKADCDSFMTLQVMLEYQRFDKAVTVTR